MASQSITLTYRVAAAMTPASDNPDMDRIVVALAQLVRDCWEREQELRRASNGRVVPMRRRRPAA
jgi:hypothetical protein